MGQETMATRLRPQRIEDAERMYEILNNENFKYGPPCPDSLEAEKEWIKKGIEKRNNEEEYHYAIIYEGKVVGGCGITKKDTHVGEIGYFVDEKYWGKGIATEAVRSLEKEAADFGIVRLEIIVNPENKASIRVAEKCGYEQEGVLKKRIKLNGKYHDACLYAKTK